MKEQRSCFILCKFSLFCVFIFEVNNICLMKRKAANYFLVIINIGLLLMVGEKGRQTIGVIVKTYSQNELRDVDVEDVL